MKERTKFLILLAAFGVAYFLPIEAPRTQTAFLVGLFLVKDYARQHVLLCLVPAFFIAGAIGQFVRQGAVMRYLGASAPRVVAYGVASVSGSILAVCSCTVLPLFAGIYRRGAGLGPATAFLYSGPAINVLAMILTARVLGIRLGLARAVGAVVFAFVVGLLMAAIFRKEDAARLANGPDPFASAASADGRRGPAQEALFFATMVAILVFAGCCLSLPRGAGQPRTTTRFASFASASGLNSRTCSCRSCGSVWRPGWYAWGTSASTARKCGRTPRSTRR